MYTLQIIFGSCVHKNYIQEELRYPAEVMQMQCHISADHQGSGVIIKLIRRSHGGQSLSCEV